MNVPNLMDNRRLEVVADGLPVFAGAQLAVDSILVSFARGRHTPPLGIDARWCSLVEARRRKERTYPELQLPGSRGRLVVLALEIGGRWSSEALAFVRLLARAKARSELMRKRVEQAWRFRWLSLLGFAAGRLFAMVAGVGGL